MDMHSNQQGSPGAAAAWMPSNVPGCHRPTAAPAGSESTVMEPRSDTSMGGKSTCAPADSARETEVAMSDVRR